MTEHIEVLSEDECQALLLAGSIGRLGFVQGNFPVILPVNYRAMIDAKGHPSVLVRTRAGGTIDRAPFRVAFEVDGIDDLHHAGWSVLIQGILRHAAPDGDEAKAALDPHPWPDGEHDAWLILDPVNITGRRLPAAERPWAFHLSAYL